MRYGYEKQKCRDIETMFGCADVQNFLDVKRMEAGEWLRAALQGG